MCIYNSRPILSRFLIEPLHNIFYKKVISYLRLNTLKSISSDISVFYHNKYKLTDEDKIDSTKMFLKKFKTDNDLSYIVSEAWIPIRDIFYDNMKKILEDYEQKIYDNRFMVEDIIG